MSSKVLLVLLMFLATILLISSEVAPDDAYQNFDKTDGNLIHNFFCINNMFYLLHIIRDNLVVALNKPITIFSSWKNATYQVIL